MLTEYLTKLAMYACLSKSRIEMRKFGHDINANGVYHFLPLNVRSNKPLVSYNK